MKKNKETKNKLKRSRIIEIVLIILTVLIFISAIAMNIIKRNEKISYSDSKINFELESGWKKLNTQYIEYYKYINTTPDLASQNNTTEKDYSSYPAVINVTSSEINTEEFKTIEDVKKSAENTFNTSEDKTDLLEMNILKTAKGYDMLKIKTIFTKEPKEIVYYYYILNESKLGCIIAYSYNLADGTEIEKASDKLVDSFDWTK